MRSFLLTLVLFLGGCTMPVRTAVLPADTESWLAVASGSMPGPFADIGRHAWIVARLPDEEAHARWELDPRAARTTTTAPFDYFGRGDITVHRILRDTPDRIRALARCLDAEVPAYNARHARYFPSPGPNSNTFVAEALRHCNIDVELPTTCQGRDYLGALGVAKTESGTGVQLVALPLGLRLGLREGIEVHVGAFALGVHAWPPGLTLPVNPGRIGLDDDDGHVPIASRPLHDERPVDFAVPGLLVARAHAIVGAVAQPRAFNGLRQLAASGVDVRAALSNHHPAYAFGLSLAAGAGIPASFMYLARIYPAGLVVPFGDTGYMGLLAGVGVSGVTELVPGGLEVPVEANVDVELGARLRLGLRATATWLPDVPTRGRRPHGLSPADELTLATVVRIGKNARGPAGPWGRGRFFTLERHEMMGSSWLGFGFGTELEIGD